MAGGAIKALWQSFKMVELNGAKRKGSRHMETFKTLKEV